MTEEQNDNLSEAEEAKNALQELADITLDKYVEEEKLKANKQKKCTNQKSKKEVQL